MDLAKALNSWKMRTVGTVREKGSYQATYSL